MHTYEITEYYTLKRVYQLDAESEEAAEAAFTHMSEDELEAALIKEEAGENDFHDIFIEPIT